VLARDSASVSRWNMDVSDWLPLCSVVDLESSTIFPFLLGSLSVPINVMVDCTRGFGSTIGVAGRDTQIPSTSTPPCIARMPNGMSAPRLDDTGTPALRISVKRARFSSSSVSCFRMIRLLYHSFAQPKQKTATMLMARTWLVSLNPSTDRLACTHKSHLLP